MFYIPKYILKNGSTINVRGKRRLIESLYEYEMTKKERLEFCARMEEFISMYRHNPIKLARDFNPEISLTAWQKIILITLDLKEIVKRKLINLRFGCKI